MGRAGRSLRAAKPEVENSILCVCVCACMHAHSHMCNFEQPGVRTRDVEEGSKAQIMHDVIKDEPQSLCL